MAKYIFFTVVIGTLLFSFAYFYENDFFIYHPSLVTAFSALLVPIIAILSVYIALQQARIADAQRRISNNKLRLELFDRRIAIYYAAKTLIRQNMSGEISLKMIISYMDVVRDAKWFLTDDIHLYLNETIYNAAARLQEIGEELKGSTNQSERTKLVADRRKLRNWVEQQSEVVEQKFSLYLKFRLAK